MQSSAWDSGVATATNNFKFLPSLPLPFDGKWQAPPGLREIVYLKEQLTVCLTQHTQTQGGKEGWFSNRRVLFLDTEAVHTGAYDFPTEVGLAEVELGPGGQVDDVRVWHGYLPLVANWVTRGEDQPHPSLGNTAHSMGHSTGTSTSNSNPNPSRSGAWRGPDLQSRFVTFDACDPIRDKVIRKKTTLDPASLPWVYAQERQQVGEVNPLTLAHSLCSWLETNNGGTVQEGQGQPRQHCRGYIVCKGRMDMQWLATLTRLAGGGGLPPPISAPTAPTTPAASRVSMPTFWPAGSGYQGQCLEDFVLDPDPIVTRYLGGVEGCPGSLTAWRQSVCTQCTWPRHRPAADAASLAIACLGIWPRIVAAAGRVLPTPTAATVPRLELAFDQVCRESSPGDDWGRRDGWRCWVGAPAAHLLEVAGWPTVASLADVFERFLKCRAQGTSIGNQDDAPLMDIMLSTLLGSTRTANLGAMKPVHRLGLVWGCLAACRWHWRNHTSPYESLTGSMTPLLVTAAPIH